MLNLTSFYLTKLADWYMRMFILVMFIFRRPRRISPGIRRIHCKHSISQALTVKLIIISQKGSECYERCKIIQVNGKYHYLIQKNSETSWWLNNFAILANNVYDRNKIPYLDPAYSMHTGLSLFLCSTLYIRN